LNRGRKTLEPEGRWASPFPEGRDLGMGIRKRKNVRWGKKEKKCREFENIVRLNREK
jgi:hypothetical protein